MKFGILFVAGALSFVIANLLSMIVFMVIKLDIIVIMRFLGLDHLALNQSDIGVYAAILNILIFGYLCYKSVMKIFYDKAFFDTNFWIFIRVGLFFVLHSLLTALMYNLALKNDVTNTTLFAISTFVVIALCLYGSFGVCKFLKDKITAIAPNI